MGYVNSVAHVQRNMDNCLRSFRESYIDDVVIASSTLEEHIRHLMVLVLVKHQPLVFTKASFRITEFHIHTTVVRIRSLETTTKANLNGFNFNIKSDTESSTQTSLKTPKTSTEAKGGKECLAYIYYSSKFLPAQKLCKQALIRSKPIPNYVFHIPNAFPILHHMWSTTCQTDHYNEAQTVCTYQQRVCPKPSYRAAFSSS